MANGPETLSKVVKVALQRPDQHPSRDQALWLSLSNSSRAQSFQRYEDFINRALFLATQPPLEAKDDGAEADAALAGAGDVRDVASELSQWPLEHLQPPVFGVQAYEMLDLATRIFLLFNAGVVRQTADGIDVIAPDLIDPEREEQRLGFPVDATSLRSALLAYFGTNLALPYFERIIANLPVMPTEETVKHRIQYPLVIELIKLYYWEEGYLMRTMSELEKQFTAERSPTGRNPLANFDLHPLLNESHLFFGYVQSKYRRLTRARRNAEYKRQYEIALSGEGMPKLSAADGRSNVIKALNDLVYEAALFYRDDADTTRIADGYKVMLAIQGLQLLLAQRASNQFNSLNIELMVQMMIVQYILSRPNVIQFLQGPPMVAYAAPWQRAVEAMMKLQGWDNVSVSHYSTLADAADLILSGVRLGDWMHRDTTQDQAENFVRYFMPQFKAYANSYKAVTGLDLTADVTDARDAADRSAPPSTLIMRRRRAGRTPRRLVAAHAAAELSAYDMIDYRRLSAPARRRLLARRHED